MKTWVQDGISWRKSTRTKTSREAKWCPKYKCCKWRNSILRSGELTLLGKNVSRWSIKSPKTKGYPFESLVRAFQWCRWFVIRGYGMVVVGERRNKCSLWIRQFSLQIHSFASVSLVNVERREGPKSCGERSIQTDHWNRDPSVAGKRPDRTLSFWWIESSD